MFFISLAIDLTHFQYVYVSVPAWVCACERGRGGAGGGGGGVFAPDLGEGLLSRALPVSQPADLRAWLASADRLTLDMSLALPSHATSRARRRTVSCRPGTMRVEWH